QSLLADEVGLRRAGAAHHTVRLGVVHVHGRRHVEREELAQALDLPAAEVTADVILVVVRDQHARQPHALRADDLYELAHAVRRIDRDALAALTITDQVAVVAHLPRDLVV